MEVSSRHTIPTVMANTILLVRSGSGDNFPGLSTAHRPDGISAEQCVQRLLMNRLSIRSNIPEARLKLPPGRSSLFDAVAFFASPNFVAPRPLCVIVPEKEERSRAKRSEER